MVEIRHHVVQDCLLQADASGNLRLRNARFIHDACYASVGHWSIVHCLQAGMMAAD